ncbi:CHASE domain-containing protein [Pontibacter harenae]|uniref:CHASE domain-containing protein n=1 Tax=Pontibacter harenae TaxID=2894083 RepID=UPI001E6090C5|nr:CHASE domain-containing protein [Pontibacter harenae]MCC9165405.1 CHASE domain-containing protein [Pontibacter harenae]
MKVTKLVIFIRDYFLAIVSFLLIFLLTLFVYSETKQKAAERRAKLFDITASQAVEAIDLQMRDYVQVLIGAKALFIASDTIERKPWKQYYEALNLEKNYPGIQGLGYAVAVWPDQLEEHNNLLRAEGFENFKLWPEGKRPFYTSIIYLEPFVGRNLRAFGYDMYSDSVRRSAMKMARDTKKPTMTGKVRLVQENGEDEQAGFLVYLPIYKNNSDPESIRERQLQIKGFVYSPFRAKDLMSAVLGKNYDDLDIEVYDGNTMDKASVLFSTDSTLHYHSEEKRPFSKLSTIRVGNRIWRVYSSADDSFGNATDVGLPYFILMGGSIMSLLIFLIVWSLSNSRRSNRIKQSITDNATAALFMINGKGYCTFMNPAAEEMTGYTLEEMKAKPLHEMIHHTRPDGSPFPVEECSIGKVLPTNTDVRAHEDVYIRKDGSFFDVVIAAKPIMENNVPSGTIIEVRDITEEKKVQQAILESEARFRTMADSAPVMIWMADAWGQCMYVNDQWLEFTGKTFEENINFGWLQPIASEDGTYYEDVYKKACAEAAPFRVEYRMKRSDGQQRWVVNTGTPRFGASNEFLGHIGSVLDITEIKEAERKIKQNAELLQKLFLEVPALVALLRAPDQQYVLANPQYRKLYGSRPLVGKTLREAHPELEGIGFFERLDKVFSSGKAYVGQEVTAPIDRNSDGNLQEAYFNLVYQPLLDGKGKVEAVLLFAVEVTELVAARKKLAATNEELSQTNQELQRINDDLDSFVYTASHDLKSPIANMEGLITLLRDILQGKLEGEDSQVLDMVGNSINKLKLTVADLAEITKVQKELQESIEPLSFQSLLQDVEADISSLIEEADAIIETDFQVDNITYARKNLRSIIYNLVSNAIKYRDPTRQPLVQLSTCQQDGYIVLEVQDNGLGIKKEQQHKLFNMFKRLHSHVEGTGIGLYIVKRIIENNGGRIEVESELGKGTTFKVRFKQVPIEAQKV